MKPAVGQVFASIAPSRPAWGAWIETLGEQRKNLMNYVAPRMGRVD